MLGQEMLGGQEVTTNLFLLLYALGENFNVMNFFTFMNVLISVELPCIIQDYKMI